MGVPGLQVFSRPGTLRSYAGAQDGKWRAEAKRGTGDHPVPIEKAGPAGVGFILLELGFPGGREWQAR